MQIAATLRPATPEAPTDTAGWRHWLQLTLLGCLVVALFAGQRFLTMWSSATSLPAGDDLLQQMLARDWVWPTCAGLAIAPATAWVGMRLPFGRWRWPRLLACHLAIAAAFAALLLALTPPPPPLLMIGQAQGFAMPTAGDEQQLRAEMAKMLQTMMLGLRDGSAATAPFAAMSPPALLDEARPRARSMTELWLDGSGYAATWLLLVSIAAGMTFRRRVHASERRAARLEAEKVAIELQALRAQMQPHFLFNALNNLHALIATEPQRALVALRELAELLRGSLRDLQKEVVPLWRDLQMLEHYVHIERLRFGDRVRIDIDVPEDVASLPVPPFCLQPLVENSLRHGPGKTVAGGSILVTGRCEHGELRLAVQDRLTAPESPPTPAEPRDERGEAVGFGTRYVRHRLQRVYGDGARLELAPGADGCTATICIDLGDTPVQEGQP